MKSLETVEFPPNHPELFPDWSKSPDLLPGSLQALCLEAKRGSIGAELVALALRRMGERRRRWGADESDSWAARSWAKCPFWGVLQVFMVCFLFCLVCFPLLSVGSGISGFICRKSTRNPRNRQEVALVLLCKCSLEVG